VRIDQLVAEAQEARRAFLAALEPVSRDSLTTPGLVGDWSAREIVAHLGYWAGHAVEAIHGAETGRTDEDERGGRTVDEVNETVARVARDTPWATVQKREAASFEALLERLRALDPALLDVRLPEGDTLEDAIRDDGADHYREHADELHRILSERPHD
jgi:Mycothiol maleylpyruvate isomerase N-terminal domain